MKNTYLLVLLPIVAFLAGCEQPTNSSQESSTQAESVVDNAQITDEHSAMSSLDWSGSYQGVMPCANCEGIDTTLTLSKDKTYELTETYLGEEDGTSKYEGTFTWDSTGSIVILEGITDGSYQFFVGENEVIMRDEDGNEIQGALADLYILKKK